MAEPRKAKEDVPAWGVLRNGFRNGGLAYPSYERDFEPMAVGPSEATGVIACMAETLAHRPLPQVASIRGLARSREEIATACRLGDKPETFPASSSTCT